MDLVWTRRRTLLDPCPENRKLARSWEEISELSAADIFLSTSFDVGSFVENESVRGICKLRGEGETSFFAIERV